MEITHLTEDPGSQYAKELRLCKCFTEIQEMISHKYRNVAPDALEAVNKIIQSPYVGQWENFRAACRKTWSPTPEGMERFGPIIIPERMLLATLKSMEYKVCWGLAFLRLAEVHGWDKEIEK